MTTLSGTSKAEPDSYVPHAQANIGFTGRNVYKVKDTIMYEVRVEWKEEREEGGMERDGEGVREQNWDLTGRHRVDI